MLRGILSILLAVSARAACPTSAGDPITTYGGVSTRYWLPNGTATELFRMGGIALMGIAGPTPGYNTSTGEWLHVVDLIDGGETILHVAVNHSANLVEKHSEKMAMRALHVRIGGDTWTGTGRVRSGGVSISAEVTASAHAIPVESLRVAVRDELGLVIRSSAAHKFASKAEQARHIHLDLEWTHIARKDEARGVLPEIWGLSSMSASVKAMLEPKGGRRLEEEDCPSAMTPSWEDMLRTMSATELGAAVSISVLEIYTPIVVSEENTIRATFKAMLEGWVDDRAKWRHDVARLFDLALEQVRIKSVASGPTIVETEILSSTTSAMVYVLSEEFEMKKKNSETQMIRAGSDTDFCALTAMYSSSGTSWTCTIAVHPNEVDGLDYWYLIGSGGAQDSICRSRCLQLVESSHATASGTLQLYLLSSQWRRSQA